MRVALPRRSRASRGLCPSATSMSRWNRSSSSMSASCRPLRKVRASLDHTPMTSLLLRGAQDLRNRRGHLVPPLPLGLELPASFRGDGVDARAPPGVRHLPRGGNQAALRHPVQRRIQRARLHAQHIVGHLLDIRRNRESMVGTTPENFQYQQVERALQFGFGHDTDIYYRHLYNEKVKSRCSELWRDPTTAPG